jgi:hypothetical protein
MMNTDLHAARQLDPKPAFEGGGLILFHNVEEAIRAEKALKAGGYEVRLVAPPAILRKGCDLAVEFNLVEMAGVERFLDEEQAGRMQILPLKGAGELLKIVKVTDFGDALMVKAGNMKLTFEKNSGRVLNVSGGGCPDIPSLHAAMIDRRLDEVKRPRDAGHTLCALMLDRALTESLEIWTSGRKS